MPRKLLHGGIASQRCAFMIFSPISTWIPNGINLANNLGNQLGINRSSNGGSNLGTTLGIQLEILLGINSGMTSGADWTQMLAPSLLPCPFRSPPCACPSCLQAAAPLPSDPAAENAAALEAPDPAADTAQWAYVI